MLTRASTIQVDDGRNVHWGTEFKLNGDPSGLVPLEDVIALSQALKLGFVDVYIDNLTLEVMSEDWFTLLESENIRLFVL